MNPDSLLSPRAKVLIVDDHPNAAALLARALASLGSKVEVVSATSGYQALEILQAGPVDILITDMDMPGMTGLELIGKLQQHPAELPTFSFLLTASQVPGLKIAARRLNVTEVLCKPIHPEQVCQIIRQALTEMDQFKQYKELAARKRFKILIADHEPDSVTLLSRYLEGEGYTYIFAGDSEETLEQINQANPDLVLLEAGIAHRDGLTVLEEIRADPSTQHIPVILLSAAWINATEIPHDIVLGTDDFVSKPIDRAKLIRCIRKKLLMKELQLTGVGRRSPE